MQANLTSSDGLIARAGLGDEFTSNGATYKYLMADGAITAFSLVGLQNDGEAAMLDTTISGVKPTSCAIPQFAVADNEYFWAPVGPFQLKPDGTTFKVRAQTNCAGSVKLYTHATAGTVDDTATDLVAGLLLTETITTAEDADCIAVQRLVTNCQD